MKKFLILFVVFSFFVNVNKAYCFVFPTFDIAGFKQIGDAGVNVYSQSKQSVLQWKSMQKTIAILGSIKKALEKLKELKERIDRLIDLFDRALGLVDEAIRIAETTVSAIEDAKELIKLPVEKVTQAKMLADRSIEYLKSADEYAAEYKQILDEMNAIRNSGENVFGKLEEMDRRLMELNSLANSQIYEARSLARDANRFLEEVANMYQDLTHLNRKILYNQERACMLKVKAKQLKIDFRVEFCKDSNSVPGVSGKFCGKEYDDSNETQEQKDVCDSKVSIRLDNIIEFEDAVRNAGE